MSCVKTFAVVGGDKRQEYLVRQLCESAYITSVYGLPCADFEADTLIRAKTLDEALQKADCIILPLPFTTDKTHVNAPLADRPIVLNELYLHLKKAQTLIGGKLDDEVYKNAALYDFAAVDFFKCEELEILNAVPTAEGALQIAMEQLPVTLHASSCLVTGYGRVAKLLCRILGALQARVTVAARSRTDIAWAQADGFETVNIYTLNPGVHRYDVIFNTVPALIFDRTLLAKCDPETLLIDLASRPGGIDFEAAGELGLKTVWALSLPGKVAPKTSGDILVKTILNIIGEEKP